MGCAASTKKKNPKHNLKKEKAEVIVAKAPKLQRGRKNSPDAVRKVITELHKRYKAEIAGFLPFLSEKAGVAATLHDERERLLSLLEKYRILYCERGPLMDQIWERDAADIHNALSKFTADKAALIAILATRTKWQIACIGLVYEKQYGSSLLEQVVSDLTSILGSLMTGNESHLAKLFTYRIQAQPDRDAALLRDFTDGFGLEDENLIDLVCTRSNEELKSAMEVYLNDYGKHLPDVVKSKSSYENYRNIMMKVLECTRNESDRPLDAAAAKVLADELYNAGGARNLGIIHEPFIRIFSTMNKAQFDSINEEYKGKRLLKDITSKMGGNFETLVLAMCADKYEYIAKRLHKLLAGSSVNREGICRALGCISRWECTKVREAFDKGGYNRTLVTALKSSLKGHYQVACVTLVTGDVTLTPSGSNKEEYDDEAEIVREGDRARKIAEVNYSQDKMIERGKALQLQCSKRQGRSSSTKSSRADRTRKKKEKKNKLRDSEKNSDKDEDEEGEEDDSRNAKEIKEEGSKQKYDSDEGSEVEYNSEDEFEVIRKSVKAENKQSGVEDKRSDCYADDTDEIFAKKFTWDGAGRFLDIAKLRVVLKRAEEAHQSAVDYRARLVDTIAATKDVYFAISKHCCETETRLRIHGGHVRNFKQFISRREIADRAVQKASGTG